VIQFALLFGLGFLTAVLIACMVAPAIHRRIVWFTEKRLRATMPLSVQEVRAQKDMARALYAAENAKTEQALAKERGKSIALQLAQETLKREAGRLSSENEQLHAQIDEMSVEAGDLRSRLRREEAAISQLKSGLRQSEQAHSEKEHDLDGLRKRIDRMVVDADNMKIDLAAREAEMESLRMRFNGLRTERDALRTDLEAMTRRAKDAEIRLGQEEEKGMRLDEKLNREVAANADKQALIDRRSEELSRLREKMKASSEGGRGEKSSRRGARPAKATELSSEALLTASLPGNEASDAETTGETAVPDTEDDLARLSEEARNRSTALSDRLLKSRSTSQDAALREEIAAIAANMVALTAIKEGEQSPIRSLLGANPDKGSGERRSLADRASDLLEKPPV